MALWWIVDRAALSRTTHAAGGHLQADQLEHRGAAVPRADARHRRVPDHPADAQRGVPEGRPGRLHDEGPPGARVRRACRQLRSAKRQTQQHEHVGCTVLVVQLGLGQCM